MSTPLTIAGMVLVHTPWKGYATNISEISEDEIDHNLMGILCVNSRRAETRRAQADIGAAGHNSQ